jgi:DNA-binding PadR family transcriptional regulator
MAQPLSYKHIDAWLVKKFLDLIILKETKCTPLSGYEILSILSDAFDIRFSSGTIYSKLYMLEKYQLIEAQLSCDARRYKLARRGQAVLENIAVLRTNKLKTLNNYF